MQEIVGVFGIDWRLLIIQMINFGILLLVLWYFLYRPLVRMIYRRQEKIKQGVLDAERIEKEFIEVEDKRKEILSAATHEADTIVKAGKQRGEREQHDIIASAREVSEKMISDAELEGKEVKDKILSESKEEIARLSVLAAERLLKRDTS